MDNYYFELCLVNKDFYNVLQLFDNPQIYDYQIIKNKLFKFICCKANQDNKQWVCKIKKIKNFDNDLKFLQSNITYKRNGSSSDNLNLTFGDKFNQPIDKLPSSITHKQSGSSSEN